MKGALAKKPLIRNCRGGERPSAAGGLRVRLHYQLVQGENRMFVSALHCAVRRTLGVVLAGALIAPGWAQTAAHPAQSAPDGPRPQRLAMQDYSKPRSYFPNPVGPYLAHHLPPPDLLNTARIEQMLRDGKLYLSMNDAVALAMENNLDIAISRYNLNIADTDVCVPMRERTRWA